ncbi:hypothetical protein RM780_25350 [Streptomyces sp. DSM 44917]|uniref:Uncharacterized protein n=1 Tax=Streptomyces boetiae TaxID=3075541 RepID=A0ABU2LFA6_9ACTN|nr:hypothetical protein [Streptomyces sp. DSM 44917]MDT0310254.1 hypothetical protein [Streptomyces sp. DSM 44917]
MAINIELLWNQGLTLGELEEFVAHARAAGGDAATPIEEITHDQDPTLHLGWRVTAQGVTRPTRLVAMPHRLMWNLHSMLEQIGGGDGDVRGLLSEIIDLDAELWEALMKHVGE